MEHVVISVAAADVEASDEGALYPSLEEATREALIAALNVLADEIQAGRDLAKAAVVLKKTDGEFLRTLKIVISADSADGGSL